MAMQIDVATKHGVNVFIFDWYWYDGRPFMETTLNNGFLKAENVDKMKFYLMWANHDVNSWNERTETSYLLPCNVFGYGYLEAVKEVFK